MKLNLQERHMVTKIFKERYRWALKKEKSLILDEFVEVYRIQSILCKNGFTRLWREKISFKTA